VCVGGLLAIFSRLEPLYESYGSLRNTAKPSGGLSAHCLSFFIDCVRCSLLPSRCATRQSHKVALRTSVIVPLFIDRVRVAALSCHASHYQPHHALAKTRGSLTYVDFLDCSSPAQSATIIKLQLIIIPIDAQQREEMGGDLTEKARAPRILPFSNETWYKYTVVWLYCNQPGNDRIRPEIAATLCNNSSTTLLFLGDWSL
jgi:hypothetical protein